MEALHALQTVDDALDRLQDEEVSSPLHAKVREARARLEALRVKLERVEAKEASLNRQLRRLELDLNAISGDIAGVETKLFGGEVRSAKELSNLQERHAALLERKGRLEDAALASMEEVEAVQALVTKAREAARRATQRLAAAELELSEAQAAWEAERARLSEERAAAAARVDSHHLERYERLRERIRRPVAKVENGTCGGCHLSLPTAMKSPGPGELSQCPHCGRILWWSAGE